MIQGSFLMLWMGENVSQQQTEITDDEKFTIAP